MRQRIDDFLVALLSDRPTMEKYRAIRKDRKLLKELVYSEMIEQSATEGK